MSPPARSGRCGPPVVPRSQLPGQRTSPIPTRPDTTTDRQPRSAATRLSSDALDDYNQGYQDGQAQAGGVQAAPAQQQSAPAPPTVFPPPPLPPASSAQIREWIGEASAVLLDSGSYTPSQLNAADIALIISKESSNIPNNVNTSDSNWKAGIPSQGLMQVTPPNFNHWALGGYNDNIMDPVQNIIAGVRYAIANYGSLDNVPGVVQVSAGGKYVGY